MLIQCPECEKEVSDKINQCIHCGYVFQNKDMTPNKENNLCIYNGVQYDLTPYLDFMNDNISPNGTYTTSDLLQARSLIERIIPLNTGAIYNLIDYICETKCVPNIYIPRSNTSQPTPSTPSQPHCPKCNSTSIQMVPRKWSFFAGFATNKVDRVCMCCKHRW